MTDQHPAEIDALREVEKRIEKARSEHWQQHLREHPYADAKSCPRDYGIHDAFAAAANIVRDVVRERRVTPPASGTPQNPVDGRADPCPSPGYAGRHTAVGAGALSSPYVCHGCSTWFVIPPASGRSDGGDAGPQSLDPGEADAIVDAVLSGGDS